MKGGRRRKTYTRLPGEYIIIIIIILLCVNVCVWDHFKVIFMIQCLNIIDGYVLVGYDNRIYGYFMGFAWNASIWMMDLLYTIS